MNEIVLTGIITSAITFATPYLYAALGEMFRPQFPVHVLGAANEPDAGHPVAPLVDGLFGGSRHPRVLRQPQIVIGAQVQHRLAVRHSDRHALWGDNHPLVFVCPRRANPGQL